VSTNDIPCYAFTVRHASRHLSQFYESKIGTSGIHTQQFTILAIINGKGPLTITELAEEMAMDRTTVTRSLGPLERDGNLSIVPHENDKRIKVITITAQGKAQLEVALEQWRQAQADFEAVFGAARAAHLRDELRAAAEAVST